MIDGLFLRISDKHKMYGHIYFSFVVYDLLALLARQPGSLLAYATSWI